MTEARRKQLARVTLVCMGGFAVLMTVATAVYPGGTWLDKTSPGYDFWRNYWCDLLHDPALNGEPNGLGARFAQCAMTTLAVGLGPYWLVVSDRFAHRRRRALWSRSLGMLGALGLLCVTLLPSNRFALLHSIAVVLAGPMGIAATLLSVIGLASTPGVSKVVQALGSSVILLAAVTLIQYVRQVGLGAAETAVLPALLKLTTALLLLWMCSVCWSAQQSAAPQGFGNT